MRKIILTVIIGVIIIAGILYEQREKQETVGYSGKIENITLGVAQETLAALAIIAAEKGYFHTQGVNVTVKSFIGGKQALINGLLKGDVDIVTAADVPIVFNSFNHHNFKIVATIGSSDNEPRIVARKDKGIFKVSDLKNKKIITKKAAAVHYFLNVFLAHNGLIEDDTELSFTKNGNEMVTLLAEGKVDAFSHREPFIGKAKELLGDNAVIFAIKGAYIKTFNLVVTDKLIGKKPDVIKRVLKALLQAERYVNKQPAAAIKLVAHFIGATEESIASVWGDLDLSVHLGRALVSSLKSEAQWVVSNQLVNNVSVPQYNNYVARGFLMAVKPAAVTFAATAQ